MFVDTRGLVERCIEREEGAWEEFIKQFSGLLFYSARERLKRNGMAFSQQDLEDIVQGIFTEMWQENKLEEVRDRRKIKSWLSIVAQTRALNYMHVKKERLLGRNEFYKFDNIIADEACDETLPAALAGKAGRMMEGLDAREKIILKLSMIHGKKHREIAEITHLPINTVSTIIARKKKVLKDRLKKLKENG